ncbi:hypothetical protein LTR36_005407 [Oleoguttula mirabilis]|uniref:Uncharacterized protein n=1 Tax=Oleoguttula mirabilis TaxID=1507867 RepID=A0AAV9JFG9_9PEZI|nr:hypothetical protein LTR36_005407 [Oleoguttula mirabilis]
MFVTYAFKRALPRSRAAGTINIRTLVQYRHSMLHWAGRSYGDRDIEFLRRRLFNDMVKAMQYMQKRYSYAHRKKGKTWLGLAELRQPLDFEAIYNGSIELSEQHQLLWCIGRITALRPGSLCPSGPYTRDQAITWRDLDFEVGDEPGKFTVRITLDHLDIKRTEGVVTAPDAPSDEPVPLRLDSPESHNLVFSPAHRLLVIALRRGILEGIESLDDLFDSTLQYVSVKEDCLDQTVFYRGVPKGTGLDYTRPMNAHAITEYLQRRGYLTGYTTPITYYSLRRRAATDMARRVGLTTTRIMIGHSPENGTLERYYLQMTETLDAIGILTDQGVEVGGHSSKLSQAWAPLALGKLQNVAFQNSRGEAVHQLTRRLIMADPSPPENPTALELKNYRRRVARFARQQLVNKEAEWQRKHITKADMQARMASLHASQFADEVLERALTALSAGNTQQEEEEPEEDHEEVGEEDEDGSRFVRDEADEQAAEPDLEQVLLKGVELDDDGTLTLSIDDEVDAENAGFGKMKELSYHDLAKSAMLLLLDNALSTYATWSQRVKTCYMCQEDGTVDLIHKTKEYGPQAWLEAHIAGHFHHPVSQWRRRAEANYKDEDDRYFCPFCEESESDEASLFNTMMELIRHIMQSTARSLQAKITTSSRPMTVGTSRSSSTLTASDPPSRP